MDDANAFRRIGHLMDGCSCSVCRAVVRFGIHRVSCNRQKNCLVFEGRNCTNNIIVFYRMLVSIGDREEACNSLLVFLLKFVLPVQDVAKKFRPLQN